MDLLVKTVILVFFLILMIRLRRVVISYLKVLILVFSCVILPIWPIPLMLRRPGCWKNSLIPMWQIGQTIKLLGVKYIVRGHENIVKDTGCVVLINHQSAMDIGVVAELWPILRNCVVVAKREVMWFSGLAGLAARLSGTIFINRSSAQSSLQALNSTVDAIVRKKLKLVIFPEGTRNSGENLTKFKKGGFHVALTAQAPIQPVVVSKYYFLDNKQMKFDSGISYITILPPISTEGLKKGSIDELMEKTYRVMNEEFKKSSEEMLQKMKKKSGFEGGL